MHNLRFIYTDAVGNKIFRIRSFSNTVTDYDSTKYSVGHFFASHRRKYSTAMFPSIEENFSALGKTISSEKSHSVPIFSTSTHSTGIFQLSQNDLRPHYRLSICIRCILKVHATFTSLNQQSAEIGFRSRRTAQFAWLYHFCLHFQSSVKRRLQMTFSDMCNNSRDFAT
uniref:Uncharacterized protein n=1 Tax=Parascaris univalens TaxID=6257 RepID=A0A914ZXB6_PARUN